MRAVGPGSLSLRLTSGLGTSSLGWSFLLLISTLISSSHSSPINRQAGIGENVYITVQNDTYGNEQRVCSIESMTYEDGESIPTSSPCEHCVCRPPGFACTIISCEYRPGCKAMKRSNQCCPEYQCECEKDGKIYQNGEKILDENNPCEVCYCQGGDVVCAVIDCYWRNDCQPRYVENRCCPLYDHCAPPSGNDIGPIRPTQRPLITSPTTVAPSILWFNLSSAVYSTIATTEKPQRLTSTELIPIPEHHVVHPEQEVGHQNVEQIPENQPIPQEIPQTNVQHESQNIPPAQITQSPQSEENKFPQSIESEIIQSPHPELTPSVDSIESVEHHPPQILEFPPSLQSQPSGQPDHQSPAQPELPEPSSSQAPVHPNTDIQSEVPVSVQPEVVQPIHSTQQPEVSQPVEPESIEQKVYLHSDNPITVESHVVQPEQSVPETIQPLSQPEAVQVVQPEILPPVPSEVTVLSEVVQAEPEESHDFNLTQNVQPNQQHQQVHSENIHQEQQTSEQQAEVPAVQVVAEESPPLLAQPPSDLADAPEIAPSVEPEVVANAENSGPTATIPEVSPAAQQEVVQEAADHPPSPVSHEIVPLSVSQVEDSSNILEIPPAVLESSEPLAPSVVSQVSDHSQSTVTVYPEGDFVTSLSTETVSHVSATTEHAEEISPSTTLFQFQPSIVVVGTVPAHEPHPLADSDVTDNKDVPTAVPEHITVQPAEVENAPAVESAEPIVNVPSENPVVDQDSVNPIADDQIQLDAVEPESQVFTSQEVPADFQIHSISAPEISVPNNSQEVPETPAPVIVSSEVNVQSENPSENAALNEVSHPSSQSAEAVQVQPSPAVNVEPIHHTIVQDEPPFILVEIDSLFPGGQPKVPVNVNFNEISGIQADQPDDVPSEEVTANPSDNQNSPPQSDVQLPEQPPALTDTQNEQAEQNNIQADKQNALIEEPQTSNVEVSSDSKEGVPDIIISNILVAKPGDVVVTDVAGVPNIALEPPQHDFKENQIVQRPEVEVSPISDYLQPPKEDELTYEPVILSHVKPVEFNLPIVADSPTEIPPVPAPDNGEQPISNQISNEPEINAPSTVSTPENSSQTEQVAPIENQSIHVPNIEQNPILQEILSDEPEQNTAVPDVPVIENLTADVSPVSHDDVEIPTSPPVVVTNPPQVIAENVHQETAPADPSILSDEVSAVFDERPAEVQSTDQTTVQPIIENSQVNHNDPAPAGVISDEAEQVLIADEIPTTQKPAQIGLVQLDDESDQSTFRPEILADDKVVLTEPSPTDAPDLKYRLDVSIFDSDDVIRKHEVPTTLAPLDEAKTSHPLTGAKSEPIVPATTLPSADNDLVFDDISHVPENVDIVQNADPAKDVLTHNVPQQIRGDAELQTTTLRPDGRTDDGPQTTLSPGGRADQETHGTTLEAGGRADEDVQTSTLALGRSDDEFQSTTTKSGGRADDEDSPSTTPKIDGRADEDSESPSTTSRIEGRADEESTTVQPDDLADEKSEQQSTTAKSEGRAEEVFESPSTTVQPDGRADQESTTVLPEARADQESTTYLPEARADQETTTFVPEARADHESTTFQPEARAEHESTTFLPDARADHESTTFLPEARADYESTTFLPEARADQESTTVQPEARADEESHSTTVKIDGRADDEEAQASTLRATFAEFKKLVPLAVSQDEPRVPTTDVSYVEVTTEGHDQNDEPHSTGYPLTSEERDDTVIIDREETLPKFRMPTELLNKVEPISDDMKQEPGGRSDLTVQQDADNEVANAEETWFWRTFNRVRTMPLFLPAAPSARRPRRSLPAETEYIFRGKKVIPKKKNAKKDTRTEDLKKGWAFPRFLLW